MTSDSFVDSLSFHFSHLQERRAEAFKYHVLSADQAISMAAYAEAVPYLRAAEVTALSTAEWSLLHRAVVCAIDDMAPKKKPSFLRKLSDSFQQLTSGHVDARRRRVHDVERSLQHLYNDLLSMKERIEVRVFDGREPDVSDEMSGYGELKWEAPYVTWTHHRVNEK